MARFRFFGVNHHTAHRFTGHSFPPPTTHSFTRPHSFPRSHILISLMVERHFGDHSFTRPRSFPRGHSFISLMMERYF